MLVLHLVNSLLDSIPASYNHAAHLQAVMSEDLSPQFLLGNELSSAH